MTVTGVKNTRRPRTKVDPNATPEEKFIRLATTRGGKLVHLMKLLRNLSTSYAYKIDPVLAKKWLDSFQESYEELKTAWEKSISKNTTETVVEEVSVKK